jgi:hypothetical protein
MGTRRIRGVRFQAYSGDHVGAAIPHLHADIAGREMIIEFLPWREVRTSRAHGSPIRGKLSMSERRRVLQIAQEAYDELIVLWRTSQP